MIVNAPERCTHCGIPLFCSHVHEHPGLCCDCFDLKHGMPLAAVNSGRAKEGRPLIERPWPGRG